MDKTTSVVALPLVYSAVPLHFSVLTSVDILVTINNVLFIPLIIILFLLSPSRFQIILLTNNLNYILYILILIYLIKYS